MLINPRRHNGSTYTEMSHKQYVHLKSGLKYLLIGKGRLEWNSQPIVVYRSVKTKEIWVRPEDEFFDGRFKFDKTVDAYGNDYIRNWGGMY